MRVTRNEAVHHLNQSVKQLRRRLSREDVMYASAQLGLLGVFLAALLAAPEDGLNLKAELTRALAGIDTPPPEED